MEEHEQLMTKAKLLAGIDDPIECETEMGVFPIRPMTEGEKTTAEAMLFKGLKASGGISNLENLKIEGDAERIYLNQAEYEFYILMCGLNVKGGDQYSINDVKKVVFKGNTKSVLVKKIMEVSDLISAEEKAAAFFRDRERARTGGDDSQDGTTTSSPS